jgi:hypothetical protein
MANCQRALGGFPRSLAAISAFRFLLYAFANPGFSRFKVRGSRFEVQGSGPSNLAEGCSRSSKVDYARFVEIAIGSVFEVVSQATISLNYQLSTINYSEPYADVLIISFPYCYRRFVRSL